MALTMLDVVKKVIALVIVLLLIATIDFVLIQVPDGGARIVPRTNDPEIRQAIIDQHHLDDSLIVQYADFIVHMFTGDFYTSVTVLRHAPIQDFIWSHAARTLFLLGSITLLSILAAAALTAVWRRRSSTIGGKSILGLSILSSSALPIGGLLIVQMVHVWLGSPLPMRGYQGMDFVDADHATFDELGSIVQHAILPILTGVLIVFGMYTLVFILGMRRSQGDGAAPQVGTRRSNGFWRALDSEMPFTMYLIAFSVSSTLVVDLGFSYHGLGTLLWESAMTYDFSLLMAAFFVISLICAVSMFILDLAITAFRGEPEKKGQAPIAPAPLITSARAPASFEEVFAKSLAAYRRSLPGMVALSILIIMAVAALAAPILATVEDPNRVDSYEPNLPYQGWTNPLPPSLTRSPHTGFLHPLGTDHRGQDIYSLTIYGSRSALVTAAIIFAAVFAFAFLIAIVSISTRRITGFVEKGVRTALSIVSLTLMAIPPVAILIAMHMGLSLDDTGAILAFCVIYPMWSWSAIDKVARARPGPSAGSTVGAGAQGVDRPKVGGAILHVTKFGLLIGLTAFMLLEFFGLGDPTAITWGGMLEQAYERDAAIQGAWSWVLSPFVAIMLLVSTTFVILHELEMAVEGSGKTVEEAPNQSA